MNSFLNAIECLLHKAGAEAIRKAMPLVSIGYLLDLASKVCPLSPAFERRFVSSSFFSRSFQIQTLPVFGKRFPWAQYLVRFFHFFLDSFF
jgi:hypothetical protein